MEQTQGVQMPAAQQRVQSQQGMPQPGVVGEKKSKLGLWLIIALAVIILGVGIYFLFIR